jgi:2-oxo-4-hydroxy-4-carboxy--5-ureidoimidazoline (OHCU) decarboxylase
VAGSATGEPFSNLPAAELVRRLAPLFEGAPGFLFRLAAAGPFESTDAMFARARELAHVLPEPLQVELVDAHPRLGAPPGSMSPMSIREQGVPDEGAAEGAAERERLRIAAELERLNAAYEAQFGFRYCVFVAGRARAELIPEFEAALTRERGEELRRALDAVLDIAIDRHRTAAGPPRPSGTVSP